MKNQLGKKAGLSAAAVLLFLLIAAPAFAGFLGISVADVTSSRMSELKLKEERGVEVGSVAAGSPAEKAGLKERDVVLEYNGERVEGIEQFQRLVRETPVNRTAHLLISRDGKTQTIAAKLGEPPSSGPMAVEPFSQNGRDFVLRVPNPRVAPMPNMPNMPNGPNPRNMPNMPNPRNMPNVPNMPDMEPFMQGFANLGPHIGVSIEAVSGQLADYFGVPGGGGLLVQNVEAGSTAEKAGIKAGDVIVKVDNEKVTTPQALRQALASKGDKEIPITVMRNRKEMTVTVKVEAPARNAPRRGATPIRSGERM